MNASILWNVVLVAMFVLTLASVEAFSITNCVVGRSSRTTATITTSITSTITTTTSLSMARNGSKSLKPAATPMMDSGKALARSGELLIDLTKALDLYGGALSAAGAQIRNSGDSLAQAAASCRFKTGVEIVIDELREAATCLSEATDKLNLAAEEAAADKDPVLERLVHDLVAPTSVCATKLEESGMRIMMRQSLFEVGGTMVEAAQGMEAMAGCIQNLSEQSGNQNPDGLLSAQRMTFASERLTQAGIELKGEVDNSKKNQGRAFLKGDF
jgi:hypothetical protein